jgi:BASS family bile acid:Na+ symporter
MGRLLATLGGQGPKVLFGGVFLGLLLPDVATVFRPALPYTVALLLMLSLLRVDWGEIGETVRRPGAVGLAILWMMLVSPLAMWGLLSLLELPPALATALILMAAAPPILGATAIAILLGLDGALAVVVGLLATLLTPITVPPLALALLGVSLDIGVGEFMLRLAAVVAVAFLVAAAIRRIAGTVRLRSWGSRIDGVIVLLMLVFALAIMHGVTDAILERPRVVLIWLAAAFVANPALQALGALAFSWMGLKRALTCGLLTGNCNMGLLLAALPPESDYDVVLFFALAQIPMYTLPALVLPLYRRLLTSAQGP